MLRKFVVALPIVMLAAGSTACASKKFVRTSVGEVNDKVDSMGRSLEETQERTRKNEGRIGEVDQKAQAAAQSADQANSAARSAQQSATEARNEANTKFDTIDKASKRLVYEVVLSEDSGNFKFGKTVLPAFKDRDEAQVEAKAKRMEPIIEAAMARKVDDAPRLPAGYSFPAMPRAWVDASGSEEAKQWLEQFAENRAKGQRDTNLGILG